MSTSDIVQNYVDIHESVHDTLSTKWGEIPQFSMLNVFPIQFLAPIAYTLLRLCLGLILIRLGFKGVTYKRSTQNENPVTAQPYIPALRFVGALEIVAGIFIVLGLYTQLATLLSLFLCALHLFTPSSFRTPHTPPRIFFVLVFFVSLSLFITGAGAFAFDLPI